MTDLHNFFIMEDMSDKELQKIKQYSYNKHCKKGEIVFLEGDKDKRLFLVLSGLFKVFKTASTGRNKTLNILGKGDFFGEMALIDESRRLTSVQAINEGKLLVIDRNKYKELIREFPEVALKTIGILSLRLQEANQEIKNLTFQTTEDRLKKTLKEIGEKFGEKQEEEICIRQRFTHQELADMVGTTRERITRLLGSFQQENLLRIENRTIFLNNSFFSS